MRTQKQDAAHEAEIRRRQMLWEAVGLTPEEVEESAKGPELSEIMAHFGYEAIGEWHSTWLNKPGQVERLSFIPAFMAVLGMDKRYRIMFDYDPAYPNMLLQASVIDPSR